MSCTVKDLYKSVKKCPGQRVAPGVLPFIYFIPASQIVSWPKLTETLPTAARDMSILAVYAGNFGLLADAGFHRLDLVDLKSGLTFETQGEAPSATFLNKGELVVGGTGAEIKAFSACAVNESIVYLIPDRNGRCQVIGSSVFDTKTTVAGDTGKSVTDTAQVTISIECSDTVPLPYYDGSVALATDAVVIDFNILPGGSIHLSGSNITSVLPDEDEGEDENA